MAHIGHRLISAAAIAIVLGLLGPLGRSEPYAQNQPECTVTVQPGQSIQSAIDAAQEGAVICLGKGAFDENLTITKSLMLRGAGQDKTFIEEKEFRPLGPWKPVITIASDREIEVIIEDLTVASAPAFTAVITVGGRARVILHHISVPGHALAGIAVGGSAQVTIAEVPLILGTTGLVVSGRAWVRLLKSTVSGVVWGESGTTGVAVQESAVVEITESTIQDGAGGIRVGHGGSSSTVTIKNSRIMNNSVGITIGGHDQVQIQGNIIRDNAGCGIFSVPEATITGGDNRMSGNAPDLCGYVPSNLRLPLRPETETAIQFPASGYSTLQEAIDALKPGGVLTLQPGSYQGSLTLWKKVAVQGAGWGQTVLKAHPRALLLENRRVISVIPEAQGSTLGELTITGGSTGLLIFGSATIQNVQVSENSTAIEAGGAAEINIVNSRISQNHFGGIDASGSTKISIIQSDIQNDVEAINTALVSITDSRVSYLRLRDLAVAITVNSQFKESEERRWCPINGHLILGWGNRIEKGDSALCDDATIRRLSRSLPPNSHSQPQVAVPQDVPTIQQAIDLVADGGTIIISPGTYDESVEILNLSVTLQGADKEQVFIASKEQGTPVLLFSDTVKKVHAEGITIGPSLPFYYLTGFFAGGSVHMMLTHSQVIGRSAVSGSASLKIENSIFKEDSREKGRYYSAPGIEVADLAEVSLVDTQVFGLFTVGIKVRDLAHLILTRSRVFDNSEGFEVYGSATVMLVDSEVSGNRLGGLSVGSLANLRIERSVIERNGLTETCAKHDHYVCNGIEVRDESRVTFINSKVIDNGDWGVSANLKACGYKYGFTEDFTGRVAFEGTNTIEGNNKSGNQNGMGNPGNHPWNRPDVPDGQVCLP